MGKQMEGDNQQRRKRAREARREGNEPSEEGVTTGASKQPRHLGPDAEHADRMAGPGWGKQQPDRSSPDPRPGSLPTGGGEAGDTDAFPPKAENLGAAPGDLDDDDEQVLEALSRLEDPSDAPTVTAIARETGLPKEDTERALQRLINRHDVVQELPGEADTGHRYRVKAR